MNIVLLMFALPALAQSGGTVTVSGVVTSAEDKYPLIGAHVIAGDNNGVSTLLDGSYSIDVKPGDVLTYYYVGYEEVKYTVPDGAASIKHNVELKAETKSLEDVVVIAYGVRKKGTIAGSVSTVKAEKIENTPTAAFDQALQGQVPGLTVLSSSGEPSVAATLSIRGTNSINSGTAPLYILDGAAISSADFNTINPADIESISVRTDASSRFGADRRWAGFWSVSFMWNLRQERFMDNASRWLTNAQIAVSTGTSGNSSIPNYEHLALVSGGSDYFGNTGIAPSQPGSDNLGWEKLWTTNLAFHLGFWNRLNVDIEFYNKRTSDMLMLVPESYANKGYGYSWDNIGVMVNRGFELNVTGTIFSNRNFMWSVNANVSYNRNRILELYNGVQEYEMSQTSMKLVVGHDSGEFYINRFAGVNPVNGDALWYTRDGELTNEMRDEDKVLVGKSMTAPRIGGFGTNISWKGLSLSAQFSWVADSWMINNDRYFDESNGRYSSYNQSRRLLDRWKEPGDVTDIPRHGVYTEFDDRLLEDASFLRLKNVMLSYSLPSELLSRSRFISGIRIYAQAQNLFTITGFSGLDPEGEAMQTFSDAEQVVTGIYAGLKSSALFSGSLTVMPDIQADLVYAVENFTNVYGSVWQWDILSTDSDVESVYAALYTIIARCNFYLDSIDEVMANELDVTNLGYLETYTGEVYTIRALCYSKLLECFCKAYDPATAENELGVVLRTKYSEPEPMKRASLKDSYDLVIDDLEHAEEYLDNDFDQYNSIYVTAAAAQALHARVALYMQDWQTAIDYATMLIENDAFELADGTKSYSSTDTYLTYMWNYDSSYEGAGLHDHLLRRGSGSGLPQCRP